MFSCRSQRPSCGSGSSYRCPRNTGDLQGGPGPSPSLKPTFITPEGSCPMSRTISHSTTCLPNETGHVQSCQGGEACLTLAGCGEAMVPFPRDLPEVQPQGLADHMDIPVKSPWFYVPYRLQCFSFFSGKALPHREQGFRGPGPLLVCQVARIWLSPSQTSFPGRGVIFPLSADQQDYSVTTRGCQKPPSALLQTATELREELKHPLQQTTP